MKVQAKPALVLLLIGSITFASLATPQQKTPKQSAPKRRTVRVEDPQAALLAQAEEALGKKEFARAEEALKKYLAEMPADALAHFQLGYAYVAQGKKAAAKAEFTKAIELDANLAEAHLNLGLLLLDENPLEAIGPLTRASELRPKNAQALFFLGTACERSGKWMEAISAYEKAVELDARNADFRMALGQGLLAIGQGPRAEAAFRVVLAASPTAAAARLGLAQSLILQGRQREAAREYATHLEQNPDDWETRWRLARLRAELKEYGGALVELDRLAARDTSETATPANLAEMVAVLNLRAEVLVHLEKIPEAIEALEKAARIAPQDAELRAKLGRLWLEKRDFPAAERELLGALRLNAGLTDAVRDLVAVYYLGEKYEATLRAQDELARRETPNAGWWFIRATCYDKLRKLPEAIAAYEKFLSLDEGRSDKRGFQARQRIRILKLELERVRK